MQDPDSFLVSDTSHFWLLSTCVSLTGTCHLKAQLTLLQNSYFYYCLQSQDASKSVGIYLYVYMLYVLHKYSIYCTSGSLVLKITICSYMHNPTSVESDCSPAPAYKIRVSEMVILHAFPFACFQEWKEKKKRRNLRKRARQGHKKIPENKRLFKLILLTWTRRRWRGNLTTGEIFVWREEPMWKKAL